jgi:hypothetical protein
VRRELRFRRREPRAVAAACRQDLAGCLADQGGTIPPSVTLEELGEFLERRYRVNATHFVEAVNGARFGPPATADAAARKARRELRELRRGLRRGISISGRTRGAFRLRSLTV